MAASALKPRDSSRLALLLLGFSLIGATCMLYYHLGIFMPRVHELEAQRHLAGPYSFGNDFYPIWLTARERPRDLYGPDVTREIQLGLFGRPLDGRFSTDPLSDYRTFAYPAFTDLLCWPAAAIPFPTLRILLAVALGVITVFSVLLWAKMLDWQPGPVWIAVVVVLTCSSYPVIEGLYAGQMGLLVGFLLAAALFALSGERYLLAGILMALTLIKPQMTVLEIGFLFLWSLSNWSRRKQFIIGLFSMSAILVVSATAVWPRWIPSWLHVLFGYHRYAKPPLLKEVLALPLGPGMSGIAGAVLIAGALAIALALLWRHRFAPLNSSEFWLVSALLLAITTITLLPGQAVHDHVILLPAIFLIATPQPALQSNRVWKIVLALALAVFVWPWLAAIGLVALRPFLSVHVFYSKPVFVLPMRTAAVFPFVVLALLVLKYRARTGASKMSPADLELEMRSS